MNKYFSISILFVILAAALYGYYKNIPAMKVSMRDALAYVESNWREGDVILATDDGPWVNVAPYTSRPLYRLPMGDCTVFGSLSAGTRAALGMTIADLDDIPHTRAWVFAPAFSPLHPDCYTRLVAPLIQGEPAYVVDDSKWLYSGVWLLEK